MKIAQSNLQMTSSHVATQSRETRQSLRMWVGQRPNFEGNATPPKIAVPSASPATTVSLSEQGKAANAADSVRAQEDAVNNDPRMSLIRGLIEFLTGKPFKTITAAEITGDAPASPAIASPTSTSTPASSEQAAAQPQPAGYGIEYDRQETYSESEQTSFSAAGSIQTADGKSISFELQLNMQRSYSEQSSVSVRIGDAAVKQDPLVINFAGNAAQLTSTRFAFDLDSDGKNEQINFATGGSGFLAIDRNHDGKINNGTELFGPQSGKGFSELAKLDSDQNGWIDENDTSWKDLRVLSKDASGKDQLRSLSQAGVGAIALDHVATAFDIKDDANRLKAQIQSSGIYLSENGQVGTVQQLDLTV